MTLNPILPIVAIAGPTATGKTQLAVDLSVFLQKHHCNNVIVNFDSLLFYKELNIGTAKPNSDQLLAAHHEMLSICSAKDHLNAKNYCDMALTILTDNQAKGILPILVGGSGFYLRALLKGMYNTAATPEETRQEIEDIYRQQGIDAILSTLKQKDYQSYLDIHHNDHYRLIRALEHVESTGIKISELKKTKIDPYDFSKLQMPHWKLHYIYVDIPKEFHINIIEKRTQKMIEDGLIDEVKDLLNQQNFSGKEKPLQSIGYKETISFLQGEIPTINALKDRINISTRQLAKAQRTFFKKTGPKINYNPIIEKHCAEIIPQTQNNIFKQVLNFILKWLPEGQLTKID